MWGGETPSYLRDFGINKPGWYNGHLNAMKKSDHLTPYQTAVTHSMRSSIMAHAPAVLWFTGLSGSGKSTIANQVEVCLNQDFRAHTYLLDGDNLRHGLNKDLGFSLADRSENIRRVGEVARLLADAGLIVLTAFISPLAADRDNNRALLSDYNFIEVFVDCSLAICEQRDPKGLYARARTGEIKDFTGVDSPYEAPRQPELILHSESETPKKSAAKVIEYLLRKGILTRE
jgi:adenylylsulfate kinase